MDTILDTAQNVTSEPGIYRKSVHGGKWYLASAIGQKALGFGTFFLLARLLAPADYGMIAIVLLIVGMLSQLTTVSFGDALTQRRGDIETYLDPLWTIELARSVVLTFIIYVSAPWLANFFHVQEGFLSMIRWSGVLLMLSALANIRQIYLFKGLLLKKIFYRDMAGQLAFSLTAVMYALFFQPNAWALFFGYMAQYATGAGLSYAIYPSRPMLSVSVRRLKDLLGFAKWIYGQELLEVLLAQIDKIFIGRWLDTVQLGAYAKAKDLSSTVTNTLASLMQKVGFAAFSQLQNQLPKMREGFRKSVDILFLTEVPVALILALEGGAAVNILFGSKWFVIVEPLKIFAFGNLFYAFTVTVAPVLSALGRPDILFKMNAIRTVLTVPLLYLGFISGGVNGLAWAVVIVWIMMLLYTILKARTVLLMPKTDFYPAIRSGAAACLAVFVTDLLLRVFRIGNETIFRQFVNLTVLGILYYAVMVLVSRHQIRGPYATLRSALRELHFIGG